MRLEHFFRQARQYVSWGQEAPAPPVEAGPVPTVPHPHSNEPGLLSQSSNNQLVTGFTDSNGLTSVVVEDGRPRVERMSSNEESTSSSRGGPTNPPEPETTIRGEIHSVPSAPHTELASSSSAPAFNFKEPPIPPKFPSYQEFGLTDKAGKIPGDIENPITCKEGFHNEEFNANRRIQNEATCPMCGKPIELPDILPPTASISIIGRIKGIKTQTPRFLNHFSSNSCLSQDSCLLNPEVKRRIKDCLCDCGIYAGVILLAPFGLFCARGGSAIEADKSYPHSPFYHCFRL